MDMQSQMTRPYGHDQAEDPMRIHHPEEEEHHDKGTTKVLKKVKEKARKIKNSLTKHGQGHEHDYDVEEDDDDYDEQDPEVHGAPVYESFAVRGGVTGHPESLNHPGGDQVPAPEEIIPPGTKVFPVVSSEYTKPVEPEPLRDTSYGYDAPSYPSRMTGISERDERREVPSHPARMADILERDERREAPSHPLKVYDMSEREESREDHQMPLNTSLLSATEDVTRTFAPGEDEYLGGQRKVNIERPRGLEEDPAAPGGGSSYLSGVSNYQSKVTDPTHEGGGEAGVPGIVESLGRMKVTDESPYQKPGQGLERDLPTRSHEFGLKKESGTGMDSPAGLGGESGDGIGKDYPTRSHEFEQKNDYGVDKNSPMVLASGSVAGLGEDFPGRSHESGARLGEEFPARSHETGFGTGKDSVKGSHGYGEETGAGLEKEFPATSDDVKVETTGLGRDLPTGTGTHDQFSPELSRPKERDYIDSKAEEMGEERHESKPSTYTEKIGSATSFVTDKAIAAKNAVASKLGYSGESGGGAGQQQSPVGGETAPRSATGYGQKVAGTVVEKLAPVYEKVKETGSNVMTKLPLSGGVRGVEEKQQVGDKGVSTTDYLAEKQPVEDKGVSTRGYLAEKLRPGEEDKALSEVIAEKLHLGGGEKKTTTTKEVEVTVEKIPTDQILEGKKHGEAVSEEGKVEGGGGMVGKVKGAVTSWLGGTTAEVKPKTSDSVDESTQSLGSTVGTTGFSDSSGALSGQRGLQDSGN